MSRYIVRIVFVLSVFLSYQTLSAQQLPNIGWFSESQLFYNPAYAGAGEELRATVLTRLQWKGIEGAPFSTFVNVDAPLGKSIGAGINVYHDEIGRLVNNSVMLNGSYRIYLNARSNFQFGLKAGVSFIDVKRGSGLFKWDEGDPLLIDESTMIPRVGFGMLYQHEKYYVGVAAPDLVSTDPNGVLETSGENAAVKKNFFFTAGTNFEITEYLTFKPAIVVRHYADRPLNYGANLAFELNQAVEFGAAYLQPEIYAVFGKVSLSPRLKFGYRHEYSPNSTLVTGSTGTGEFLLTYGFN